MGFATVLLFLIDIHLIVLLRPDFNRSNNFALSLVDKVTTGA